MQKIPFCLSEISLFFFFLVLLGDQHSFGILTLRGKSSMCLKSLKFTISSLLPCMRTKSSVGFSVPHQQPYAWDKPRFSPLATFRIGRYPYLIFSSSLKGFLPARILVSIIPIAFKSLDFLTLIVSYSEVEMCQAIYFCKWTMITAQWFHYCAIIFSHIAKVSQDCWNLRFYRETRPVGVNLCWEAGQCPWVYFRGWALAH